MPQRKACAVFWDMDGTLIDTEELHYIVIRDWCAEHGLRLTPEDNVRLMGKTMPEKWRILAPLLNRGATEADFRSICEARYIKRLTPDLGMERALRIVRRLALYEVPQACVSNGEKAVLRANVAILGLTNTFAFLVSGEDIRNGKPDPEPYRLSAQLANLPPEECLVVEDSLVGVRSARAAGCIVCGWPHALEALDPDYDVDHLLVTGDEFPFDFFI